ncbi:MAG: PASTA domain-containing protein [Clostridiaceae bacterium]
MGWKKGLMKGGKVAAEMIAPDVLNLGAKIGNELLEMQKNLVKIPDLKDVKIDEALRVLKDELNLTPTSAIANPKIAYAHESENDVMYSEPKFGSRVNPGATVKVYYLTQEVIDKSKELLGNKVQEFKVPRVIGLNIYEAREDLESLGLKVTEKLEIPSLSFVSKEDGQVTRVTYPNDQKVGSKLRTGDRVWLYYVNEEVILESKSLKDKKDKDRQVIIDKIEKVAKEAPKGIFNGAVDAPKNIAENIRKKLTKEKASPDKSEE